ncbi:MAG: glycosyltransferase [Pyrinomonadaceae bacterium]
MSKQTFSDSSLTYDLDVAISEMSSEAAAAIEIKDDFLVMAEVAGASLLQQAEELAEERTRPAQQERLSASQSLEIPESFDELSEARARLASYETQIGQLSEILSEMHTQLRNKNEILNWVVRSRSWRITAWLRRLSFLSLKMRPELRQLDHVSLHGALEKPEHGASVAKHIEIKGWVYSAGSTIVRVEAFLDTISLGFLRHGQPRLDVAVYPSPAPVNCGYEGTLLVDGAFAGRRTLTIRVTDQQGRIKDYDRIIEVAPHQDQLIAGGVRDTPKIQQREAGLSLPVYFHDDLSAAKRMLASMSKISLESFLLSDSTIEFPHHEKPLTSILLVLFNRAELTLQCLYSILKSNTAPYEVVIIDNASTDATRALLKRIKGARIVENETNVHYLLASNQAARLARGEYLLLLNNDAQLQGDSISAASETLESADDIGAVGGKVILPDGTLQEAGSIIWRDGSCLGYGRGESPFAADFMFQRDVDYCSAAFLLTRRELFWEHGGFDEAYLPAYYEETDYCVRLWKQGKRVVYDPRVSVLHYEFASSGSQQSAIDLQTEHRKIFATKHRDWLHSQFVSSPKRPLAARTHQQKGVKRILYLDDRVPHTHLGAGFPRSNRILAELVKMGCLVTYYPLNFPHEEWLNVYQDIPRQIEVILDRGKAELETFLTERADYYDLIYISRPHNLATFKTLLAKRPQLCGKAKIVYDAEALFSLRKIENLRLKGKQPSVQEQRRLIEAEVQLAEGCHTIISVSENERQEFVQHGYEDVHVLGHTLVATPTPKSFDERSNILFVGPIHEPDSPNADSVLWFGKKILPAIQKKLGTDVKFVVAGHAALGILDQLKSHAVVLGRVEDLTELYNNARLFIAPTRFSAGIPHKVHEAAANGLPLVATSLIGNQLGWQNEKEILLADTEAEFAAACVRLYQDRILWNQLRLNALKRVELDCCPDAFSNRLKATVE